MVEQPLQSASMGRHSSHRGADLEFAVSVADSEPLVESQIGSESCILQFQIPLSQKSFMDPLSDKGGGMLSLVVHVGCPKSVGVSGGGALASEADD